MIDEPNYEVRGNDDFGKKVGCCCMCSLIVIGLAIGITAWATSTVEPIEYALNYSTLSKSVDTSKVYTGGWYVIGPMNSFITFPAINSNVDFSNYPKAQSPPIQTRSGSLSIVMAFSFQYSLIKEQIPLLYAKFNKNYEVTFISLARDTVAKVAAQYNIDDFWTNRQNITQNLMETLDEKLNTSYARCTGFQILNVQIPTSNEDALVVTQIAVQERQQKIFQQQASNIRTAIEVDTSDATKNITVLLGEAQANSTTILNNADAFTKNVTISAQSTAYTQVAAITGQNPSDTLIDYIYYTNLLQKKNSTLLVGVNSAIISMSGNSGKGYQF